MEIQHTGIPAFLPSRGTILEGFDSRFMKLGQFTSTSGANEFSTGVDDAFDVENESSRTDSEHVEVIDLGKVERRSIRSGYSAKSQSIMFEPEDLEGKTDCGGSMPKETTDSMKN